MCINFCMFIMKKIFFVFYLSLTLSPIFSQIKPNEKLVFAASYNMSGLMTQLAQVTMETNLVQTSKKTFLHLSLEAATFSKWDSFFKIRDLYESYVDPSNLKPSLYKRNMYEGGYTKMEKYIFNQDGKTISGITKKRNKPEQINTFKVGINTLDVISMVYKLRLVNFEKYKPGQILSYVIVFDQKEFPVSLKYMGKETISTGIFGSKTCYKISIAAKTNALRGKDKNLIWLTADAKKIPVLAKFSIPVGTGQLLLSSATGM